MKKWGSQVSKLLKYWVLAAIASVLLVYSLALAKNKVKGRGGKPPGWEKGKKEGWRGAVPPGIEKKGDWLPPGLSKEEPAEGKDSQPPGWSQGKKEGWKDADMPTGLEKKIGQPPPGLADTIPADEEGLKAGETIQQEKEKEKGEKGKGKRTKDSRSKY